MVADAGSGRPVVGREEAVEALRQRLEEVRAGSGGPTLLVGESGGGTSAVLAQVVEEVRARGIPVLVGRAPPLDAPPPFSLLRSVVESAHAAPTPSSGAESSPRRPPALDGLAPRTGDESLPDLVSMEERLLDAFGGSTERGGPERDRWLAGLALQLLEITHRGPLVLVLEDIHRGDDASLAAVVLLAERLEREPFWLLATSPPAGGLSAAGRARLEEFERTSRAQPIWLGPSSVSESRASAPGPTALDPAEQRVLAAAAVLGPEFGLDALKRVAGEQDEAEFTAAVARLTVRGHLVHRSDEVLAFPGDRLREEVYAGLSPYQREVLHWSVGETLEAIGRGGVANVYALARHFYLGQAPRKSVKYNRLAAEIADRALAPEVARDHLLRAVESQRAVKPPSVEEESDLVLELARITEELGHLPESEKLLRDFLDREKDDPQLTERRRGSLEVFLCRVLTDRGNLPAASELAVKVLDSPALEHQPLLRLGAHHQLGMTAYYEGDYAKALTHHTEELRLAREVGNPLVVLRAQIWRVADLAMLGLTDDAVAEARAITVARDRLGSLRESAQAHLLLGDMLADARCTPAQRQEALVEYARAVEFAEKAHDPRRVGWARYKTAELLREARRVDEATASLEAAVAIFHEIGDSVGLSMALKVQGQVALDQGAYDRAETHLTEAYRLLRGLHHTLEEIDVVLQLGELEIARGDPANAQRHVTELERLKLPVLRPDLREEYGRLKQAVGRAEGERAHR